jgi:hypothetical protein
MTKKVERERHEAKRQRRMQRQEQWLVDERKQRVRQRLRRAGFAVGAMLAAGVVGFGFWYVLLNRPGRSVETSGAGVHTGTPDGGYSTSPPTSGPHDPGVPDWGEQGEIPEPLQVHALEHGGVLIQYNCPERCLGLEEELRAVLRKYDTKVILAPYSSMSALIALTSWGKIDLLDEFDRGRIEKFVSKNRNHAPESYVP